MEEVPTRIEPCLFDEGVPTSLSDRVFELQKSVQSLGTNLHPDSMAELADFVRVMNCYYSNLIEGHRTRPKDIELALAGAEVDQKNRPLALEAKAHIKVQRQIDAMFAAGTLPDPSSIDFLRWVHREFYLQMPGEFRVMEKGDGTKITVRPGEFRQMPEEDVTVGRHQPPSSERVEAFMTHFSWRYGSPDLGHTNRVISIASAHHRFNYIHPFTDGNGRVSRLMSHAISLRSGLGAHGLWSVSRGLARGLKDKSEYMQMMDLADTPRRGDRDGRGNLSLSALKTFCEWFLDVMIDQIQFSRKMFAFDALEDRYRRLVMDVTGDKYAPDAISAVLKFGTLERGDFSLALRTSDRTARKTISALVQAGFLKSASPKTPVRVAFSVDYRERLFPNLFADGEAG
jgi:Fic family protein